MISKGTREIGAWIDQTSYNIIIKASELESRTMSSFVRVACLDRAIHIFEKYNIPFEKFKVKTGG
jgi:uncharacterized protein (DUF1778 family)